MKKLLLYVSVFIFPISLFSQTSGNQKNIVIDLTSGKTIYWYGINEANNREIYLDYLPEKISIKLSETDFASFRLQINPDTSRHKFYLSFNCNADTLCTKLSWTDIKDGLIELRFQNGQLVGIGDKFISLYKKVEMFNGKPKIKFTLNDSANKPTVPSNRVTKPVATPCDSAAAPFVVLPLAKDRKQQYHYLCRKPQNVVDDNCATEFESNFNFAFLPPCNDTNGNALTSRQHIVYDYRAKPEIITYLDIRKRKGVECKQNGVECNRNGVEYYKVRKGPLRPKANSEIMLSVIGSRDSSYHVTTNSVQYFMEGEAEFMKGLEGLSPAADSLVVSDTSDVTPKEGLPLYTLETEMKSKFIDLKDDLIVFNSMFLTIDLVEAQYRRELQCLQERISDILSIPVPESGEKLAEYLGIKLKSLKDNTYIPELCNLISELNLLYDEIINKKVNYKIFNEVLHIPNADEFKLGVTTKGKSPVFERNFNVRGGFKIDFSTGFFFTGHRGGDFVLSRGAYRYIDSRDSILSTGEDTVLYSGLIKDTSITSIMQNENLTFGTGVYAHFYSRTGRWYDIGGSAGVIVNNEAQFQILLGLSVMFKAGSNRIAIVGGLAQGKEKVLSVEDEKFYNTDFEELYGSIHDLPENYTGTNPTTYDKWQSSWFVGLTFNFASTSIGAK